MIELKGNCNISADIGYYGSPLVFFAYLKILPLSGLMVIFGFAAIVFSFVTLAEAQTLTIAELTCEQDEEEETKSEQNAPASVKIFWGVLMGLMAFALLYSGGVSAIQTASIVCALPILALMLVMAVSYIKSMRNYKEFDQTLKDGEDY